MQIECKGRSEHRSGASTSALAWRVSASADRQTRGVGVERWALLSSDKKVLYASAWQCLPPEDWAGPQQGGLCGLLGPGAQLAWGGLWYAAWILGSYGG